MEIAGIWCFASEELETCIRTAVFHGSSRMYSLHIKRMGPFEEDHLLLHFFLCVYLICGSRNFPTVCRSKVSDLPQYMLHCWKNGVLYMQNQFLNVIDVSSITLTG